MVSSVVSSEVVDPVDPSLEFERLATLKKYREFTRRIPKDEMKLINEKMKALEGPRVLDFAKAMRGALSKAACRVLLESSDAPYLALRSLHEGRLSRAEVATISLLHAALKHPGAELKSISEDREYAKRMVLTSGESAHQFRDDEDEFPILMPPRYIDSYLQVVLEKTAPIQGYFVVFPGSAPLRPEVNQGFPSPKSVSDRIHQLGISLLRSSSELEDRSLCIAPSFGMMSVALSMLTPHTCMPNPVLGLSTLHDIRMGQFHGRRDMAFPFPGVKLPAEADGYPADEIEFTYHDLYHAWIVSFIPPAHRKAFMEVSKSFEALGGKKESVEAFADLEFPAYRERGLKSRAAFWQSCKAEVVVSRGSGFSKRDLRLSEMIQAAAEKYMIGRDRLDSRFFI